MAICLNDDLLVQSVLDGFSRCRAELGHQLSLTGVDWLIASEGGKEPFDTVSGNGAFDPYAHLETMRTLLCEIRGLAPAPERRVDLKSA